MSSDIAESCQEDVFRLRATGLFVYLKKLAQLRGKPVRDVRNYEKILWFNNIPKEPECFTPAWGTVKPGHEEIWLEIKRPRFSEPPTVPAKVKPWVKEDEIRNSADIPELKSQILQNTVRPSRTRIESASEEDLEETPGFAELSDFPEVKIAWEKRKNKDK